MNQQLKEGKYIDANGVQKWCKNGELHRDDGPAIVLPDGSEYWYKDGVYHRLNGPAVTIYLNSENSIIRHWYQEGLRHRTDGPAYIVVTDEIIIKTEWDVKGKNITDEVKQWLKEMNFPPYYEWSTEQKVLFKITFG